MTNLEGVQKLGKENVDASAKSFEALTKGSQTIATEIADYSRKSFEDSAKAMEKLMGCKSIETALDVQTSYAKSAYEGFVAQAGKMNDLYAGLAKEAYKPYESYFSTAMAAR